MKGLGFGSLVPLAVNKGSLAPMAEDGGEDITSSPPPFDLLTFINNRSDGGLYLVTDSYSDVAGTTPATIGDEIARFNDQSDHSRNITEATSSNRSKYQEIETIPSMVPTFNDSGSSYAFPATAIGNVVTFFFVSANGPQCFEMVAVDKIPRTVSAKFGWVLGSVTSGQRSNILAALNTTFVTYHDFIFITPGTSLVSATAYYMGYYLTSGDYDATGSTLEVSTPADGILGGPFPPWDAAYGHSFVYSAGTYQAGDFDIDVPEDLVNFGVGGYVCTALSFRGDLPNLETVAHAGSILEGSWPDEDTWPADLKVLYASGSDLYGYYPNFNLVACKNVLQYVTLTGGARGPLDVSPLSMLETLHLVQEIFASSIDAHGLVNLGYINFSNPKPLMTSINLEGCISLSISPPLIDISGTPQLLDFNIKDTICTSGDLDTLLSDIEALGNSNGNLDLRVSGGVTPGAGGLANISILLSRSYTILVNP